jgi:hypothetical protein
MLDLLPSDGPLSLSKVDFVAQMKTCMTKARLLLQVEITCSELCTLGIDEPVPLLPVRA